MAITKRKVQHDLLVSLPGGVAVGVDSAFDPQFDEWAASTSVGVGAATESEALLLLASRLRAVADDLVKFVANGKEDKP